MDQNYERPNDNNLLKQCKKLSIKVNKSSKLEGLETTILVRNLETLAWFSAHQCWFGFAVISVLQNTLGSTLGKERGHISENKGEKSECKKFGKNSRQMAPISTICDECCSLNTFLEFWGTVPGQRRCLTSVQFVWSRTREPRLDGAPADENIQRSDRLGSLISNSRCCYSTKSSLRSCPVPWSQIRPKVDGIT